MDPRDEYIELMQEQIREHEDALAKLREERPADPAIARLEKMLLHARRKLDELMGTDDETFGPLRLEFDSEISKLTESFRARGANPPDVAVAVHEQLEEQDRAERGFRAQ